MQIPLSGPWQLSPLTDLSIPQRDLTFPCTLSSGLPDNLSECEIVNQEWHLMHDIEVTDTLLRYAAIDLVLRDIHHYAEVRLNGVAILDCDLSQPVYRKNIRDFLKIGENRFELLFLHPDEDDILLADARHRSTVHAVSSVLGIPSAPCLSGIRHLRPTRVQVEQIWHYAGGCECLVSVYFECVHSGLVSVSVTFDGRTYTVPVDMRTDHVSALFQVEAPTEHPAGYWLEIALDEHLFRQQVPVSKQHEWQSFPF